MSRKDMVERSTFGGDDGCRHAKKRRTSDALLPDVGWPIDDEATARRKLEEAGFHRDRLSEAKILQETAGEPFTSTYPATPMIYFCYCGDLPMCRYLFVHGAAADVTTMPRNNGGGGWWFPMYAAACEGHLETCQWLYEHGAAGDIRRSNLAYTPLYAANSSRRTTSTNRNRENLCRWLILKGALSTGASGHVDADILRRDLHPWTHRGDEDGPKRVIDVRPKLLSWAEDAVKDHATFLNFLTGTLSQPEFSVASLSGLLSAKLGSEEAATAIMESTPSDKYEHIWSKFVSPLRCFGGLPGIMELVADFVGVRGRDLQTAHQLVEKLPMTMVEEYEMSSDEEFEEYENSSDDDEVSSDGDDGGADEQ